MGIRPSEVRCGDAIASCDRACPAFSHRSNVLCRASRRTSERTMAQVTNESAATKVWYTGSQHLRGLQELPDKYKGVLLDQYGCLHNGVKPYPGAIEAVRYMAEERGLRILLLSNSSRRSAGALDKIAGLGFQRQWFEGVVTSGEVTHRQLAERPTPFWSQLGTRVLHITWDPNGRGGISLDGLNLQIVDDPEEAEMIVAHGTEAVATAGGHTAVPKTLQELEGLLHRCAAAATRPRMIVANPDIVTTAGDLLKEMPGHLGRIYASLGGEVHLMGKPAPIIYDAAADLLKLPPSELVAIGDSLEHDVAGAVTAGIDSLFVGGGIHADELGIQANNGGPMRPQQDLQQLCSSLQVSQPNFAMPYLTV